MLISRGASYLGKFTPYTPLFLLTPITTTKQDNWESEQQDAGSAEGSYIKIILDGINGVCTVQAKMKYEDDRVTPGVVIEFSPSYIQHLKCNGEVRCRRVTSPCVYWKLSLVTHQAMALYLCPLPSSQGLRQA